MKESFKLNSKAIRIFVACVCMFIVLAIVIGNGIVYKNNAEKQSSKSTETIITTEKNTEKTITTTENETTEIKIENIEEPTFENRTEPTYIETTKINKKEDVVKTTESPIETTTKKVPDETKGVTETTTEKEDTETDRLVSLGKFKLTAYCSCSKCCGKWAGSPTASGVMPRANHTIAVDTSIIPFGTKVVINGNTYVAEDTGGAIKGNRIDIYFGSHQAALNFGVQYAEVFIVNE